MSGLHSLVYYCDLKKKKTDKGKLGDKGSIWLKIPHSMHHGRKVAVEKLETAGYIPSTVRTQ